MANEAGIKKYAGRVAFISGAASGIGLGIAQALAERGVKLVIADVQADPLQRAAEGLSRRGVEVLALPLDVADRAAVYAAADEVERVFGKVHLVFNNAGIGHVGTPVDQIPDETFDWVVGVNLFGVMNGIKAFVPKIRKHGEGGHIVNTSSMAGLVLMPGWHQGLYSATKMGVLALSADLRESLVRDKIGVSVLCPGLVRTNIAENMQALQPEANKSVPFQMPQMLADAGMPAVEAAQIVLRGIENDDFYILTHPDLWPHVEAFHQGIRDAFMKQRAL